MISKMTLTNQSHFPRFFSIPESHLAGFCRFYKMTLPIGKKGPLCFITLWYHSIVVLISFFVLFFSFLPLKFILILSVIIYINYVRTEDDISFAYAAQIRLLRFSVLNRENALSLLHVLDVDDCDLAVVNVSLGETSRKTALSHVKVVRGKSPLVRKKMALYSSSEKCLTCNIFACVSGYVIFS